MSSAMCQQSVEKTLADLGLPLRPAWVAQCLSGHHQHLNKEEFYRLWLESDMKESSSGILPVGIGDENEEWGTKILPGRFMLQVESWKNVGEVRHKLDWTFVVIELIPGNQFNNNLT